VRIVSPQSPEELAGVVEEAVATRTAMRLRGGGSTDALLEDVDAPWQVDLSRLSGIVDYDPDELVITARAGTPLSVIETAIRDRQQILAFEPVDPARILGGAGGKVTLGGMVSSAMAGPRRVTAGSVRDHVLGYSGISGKGDIFKGGGRVVKNVTGFDTPKLFTGAWGTLAVLDTITLRLLPAPRFETTLVIRAFPGKATPILTQALNHPSIVSCAAHLHDGVYLRLEGFQPSVEVRLEQLERDFAAFGPSERLERGESTALWARVAEVRDIPAGLALWRLSVPPAQSGAALEALQPMARAWMQDWGGARLWLGVDDTGSASAEAIRAVVTRVGGTARLLRASPAVKATAGRPPLDPTRHLIGVRLKAAYDPHGLFNPGLDVYEL
jgi:glycolate oxidase FAD binding subunit